MTTITVVLPDKLRDWVESRAKAEHHEDVADYVCTLIQREQARAQTITEIQGLLDEGVDSGISNRSMGEVLEDAREQVRAKSIA